MFLYHVPVLYMYRITGNFRGSKYLWFMQQYLVVNIFVIVLKNNYLCTSTMKTTDIILL